MDSGYDSYQQVDLDAQAAAANPHQLVIMLIDGLLDEVERIRGTEKGNHLESTFSTCKYLQWKYGRSKRKD